MQDDFPREPAESMAESAHAPVLQELLNRHHARLFSFIRRKIGPQWYGKIDPEDVLQEAYIEAYKTFPRFTDQGGESFYHWMTQIIDHRFFHQVRHWRTKGRDVAREVSPKKGSSGSYASLFERCLRDSNTPSRMVLQADAASALMSAIARLPETYRMVVQRLYINEEPLAAVAADLGRSEDAVRRLASRAVQRLQEFLERPSH